MYRFYTVKIGVPHEVCHKILLVMQLTILLLIATLMHVSAASFAQKITLNLKSAPIETVLREIRGQSGVNIYYDGRVIPKDYRADIVLTDATVTEALNQLFKHLPLTFEIDGEMVSIRSSKGKKPPTAALKPLDRADFECSGRITDEEGNPLEGVTVSVKGTLIAVTTDLQGNYQIRVPEGRNTLVFTIVGFEAHEQPINGQSSINVSLKASMSDLDEVVVMGYGTQRKSSLTGAVTVVNMKDVLGASKTTGNIERAMDGRLPGVRIAYSGSPYPGTGILMRGQGTLNSTAPLYVIDGVPTTRGLGEIAASDIESVQVLRDASAATIYGSRAANGVIIVTTKKAKNGTRLEVSANTTANFLPRNPLPLLNTDQYGRAQWMAARNDGIDPNYGVYRFEDHQDADGNWVLDQIILPDYLDADQTMRPADTDWQKEISRTGISQNYNASFSTGTEKGGALLSLDYFDNQGTTKENKWNRITFRLNSHYLTLNDRLKVGEDLSIIKMYWTGGNYLPHTRNIQPIVPVRTVDGTGWGGPVMGMSDRINPVLAITNNRQNHNDDIRIFGSVYAEYKLMDNLTFKSTFGVDKIARWERNMQLKYQAGFMSETVSKLQQWSNFGGSWTWNNVLNYDLDINKSAVNFMVGQEAIYENGADMYAARDGFAIEDPDYMYLNVGETNVRNGGGAYDSALNSYFGRINYGYDSRYLLTAILRYDGSSRFGANNRYSLFPSLSAGWTISEEAFMDNVAFIDFMKLRYGWGRTGNQAIPNYASWGQYEAHYGDDDWPVNNGTAYDIYGQDSGSLPSGYRRLNLGNPDLRWETTTQNNVGLELYLFKSKLQATIDYYHKNTTDILVSPPYIQTIGLGGGRWLNGATMKNWGWEMVISYGDRIGDLQYNISLNASHNTNRITELPEEAIGGYPGNGNDQTILGRSINSFYGWVSEGIFQNQAEVDAHADQPGKDIGRLRFKDVDGNGKIDADDRTWIGVNEPDLMGGLNVQVAYKAFDFSMLWRYEFGRQVDNRVTKSYTHFFGFFGGQNYGTAVLNSWSRTNPTSTIPAISASDLNNEQRFSSYFVENASYVKLGSIELGYTLPKPVASRLGMSNLRAYVQGQNLWTIAGFGKNPFSGFDPQLPNEDYPIPTACSLGLNFTF